MTLRSIVFSAVAVAFAATSPLVASAAASPSPKPSMSSMKMMATKHQCRDSKGHFIKGTYLKCPAGSHKA